MIYDKVRALFSRLGGPSLSEINLGLKTYGLRSRILIALVGLVFLASLAGLIFSINNYFLVPVATVGGSLTEGIVGAPRFINPLLAVSDSDRDLTTLVYSGLLRPRTNGKLVGDIAKSYSISPDGKTYTFILNKGLTWQDGKPITAADVIFTVDKAKDADVKSAKRANWEGVVARSSGDYEVTFFLDQPYAGFITNATLGILPKHIWEKVRDTDFPLTDYNVNPIGSGPYQVSSIKKDSSGIPTDYYLTPFRYASAGRPKIGDLHIIIYDNEKSLTDAYRRGEIESLAAISPTVAKEFADKGAQIISVPLPRVFAVFYNQNSSSVLANKEIRQALSLAVDRKNIISTVFFNYATAIDQPIPSGSIGYHKSEQTDNHLEQAKNILTKSGWKLGPDGLLTKTTKKNKKTSSQTLTFSLVTANTPELKKTAELIISDWRKLGANVNLQVYEPGDLAQNVIQGRKYDALLFGEVISREPDLFPYWHSSQRNYPGLNISMYANQKVDNLIESARSTINESEREAKYISIGNLISNDTPATFLYSPSFIYVVPEKVKNITIPTIMSPAERFLSISDWYITTDRVWKVFANKLDLIKK